MHSFRRYRIFNQVTVNSDSPPQDLCGTVTPRHGGSPPTQLVSIHPTAGCFRRPIQWVSRGKAEWRK